MNTATKLRRPGNAISNIEVTAVTRHGVWLLTSETEYFLAFKKFPWFKKATITQITHVVVQGLGILHWPELDIDLDLNRIRNPEKYPLVDIA
jgi:hypothetical protein